MFSISCHSSLSPNYAPCMIKERLHFICIALAWGWWKEKAFGILFPPLLPELPHCGLSLNTRRWLGVECWSWSPGPTTHGGQGIFQTWLVCSHSVIDCFSFLSSSFLHSFLSSILSSFLPSPFFSSLSIHLPLPFFLLLHRLRNMDFCILCTLCVLLPCHMSSLSCWEPLTSLLSTTET